ncbi:hypothetical protein GGR51DRAFT_559963 [Nemania sp. FL0031]|nr:hypothetical protein GGR51DRAFT_559963 [Nemania sp. FL0031]
MAPKTRKRGPDPSQDLPGLFPTHDGSYGINTLINLDTEPKKGHNSTTGIAQEQSDDRQWMRSMRGKVAKKYGMNSNLKKAIDTSQKEVEKEEHQGQSHQTTTNPQTATNPQAATNPQEATNPQMAANPQMATNPPNNDPSSSSSSSRSHKTFSSSSTSKTSDSSTSSGSGPRRRGPSKPPDDSAPIPTLAPHIPEYSPNNLPFPEDYDDRPRPPYKQVDLRSANPHAYFGVNPTASPPSEHIPFYGMPHGEGSKEPISPSRPDTSRSFNYESGLFNNATVRTPRQTGGLFGAPPTTTQASVSPPRNQTVAPGGMGILGVGGQPTAGQPTAGQPAVGPSSAGPQSIFGGRMPTIQPNLQGQPTPGPSSSGPRPVSGGGQTPGAQPNQQEQRTPGLQPTARQPIREEQSTPGMQHNLQGQPPQARPRPAEAPLAAPVVNTPRQRREEEVANQRQPPNRIAPQPGVKIKSPRQGRGTSRRSKWERPSSDLVARLIMLFSVLALTLWLLLSAIPAGMDDGDIDPSLPEINLNIPDLGIGAVWKKISGLFPEIPDIHKIAYENSPSSSGTSKPSVTNDITSKEFLEEVKSLMPETIWVQNKNGKLKIPEDFWHALRQLIEKDDSILKLKSSGVSEDHWRAIKSRIQSIGGLNLGASTEDTKALVEKTISQSWESWLGQNDQSIKKALTGVALTRDDFMKLFKEESATFQGEIQRELGELQKRIKDVTQQISKLKKDVISSGGMAKGEISNMVDSMVAKAIKNVKLDAIAQGHIKGHANDVLVNQVNFFSRGAGAVIDPMLTSPVWKGPYKPFNSKAWLEDTYRVQPPSAAIHPWTQEGECFCAGPGDSYGQGTNNIHIIIARNIIPQHLVVEHILPGATLDPGAMPREIEIWAYIEEITMRNEARTFSEKQFPDTPKEEILNDGYVKLGHFTYEKKTSGDGVQVFKLSDELIRMRVKAASYVIRAINNYGADHTCFYRLRLYGEVVERPDDPPSLGKERRSWF